MNVFEAIFLGFALVGALSFLWIIVQLVHRHVRVEDKLGQRPPKRTADKHVGGWDVRP